MITTLEEVFALPLRSLSIETDVEGRITVRMQRYNAAGSYCHVFYSPETITTALLVSGEAEARQMQMEYARIIDDQCRNAARWLAAREGQSAPAVPLDVGDDDLRHGQARPIDPRD
jgi:hypothetical protein